MVAALSAIAAGYQVHAVTDASGTWNELASQAAAQRMQQAGVVLNSTVAVGAELQRDWRNEGDQELAGLYSENAIPFYGSLISLCDATARKGQLSHVSSGTGSRPARPRTGHHRRPIHSFCFGVRQ